MGHCITVTVIIIRSENKNRRAILSSWKHNQVAAFDTVTINCLLFLHLLFLLLFRKRSCHSCLQCHQEGIPVPVETTVPVSFLFQAL